MWCYVALFTLVVLPFLLKLTFFWTQVYDLTQLISSYYFKGYASLTKIQRIEWNNRLEVTVIFFLTFSSQF